MRLQATVDRTQQGKIKGTVGLLICITSRPPELWAGVPHIIWFYLSSCFPLHVFLIVPDSGLVLFHFPSTQLIWQLLGASRLTSFGFAIKGKCVLNNSSKEGWNMADPGWNADFLSQFYPSRVSGVPWLVQPELGTPFKIRRNSQVQEEKLPLR